MATFSKVEERKKLTARRDPYWSKVMKGCYVGFRKMTAGSEGNWSARYLDETTAKQSYKTLGDFSELPDHLRHDAAQKAAQVWFEHLGKGGSTNVTTVTDACANYVDHLRATKGERAAHEAQGRFKAYVLGSKAFAATELSKLTPKHIGDWRLRLQAMPMTNGPKRGERRSDSTLNRDMTCVRAALNLAYAEGLLTSDFAWRGKLKLVEDADQRREVYLDADQRRMLISHAPADLADFLRALSLIPLRPGALAALTAASYDKRLKTITIGKDKAGQDRKIALPDATAAFFADHCKGKLPGAVLIARANGKAWNKDAWKWPIKAAVVAAKLPVNITAYAMRHSTITDLIHGGLDALTVAQLSGTSVLMIQKHYGHLTQKHSREALARLVL